MVDFDCGEAMARKDMTGKASNNYIEPRGGCLNTRFILVIGSRSDIKQPQRWTGNILPFPSANEEPFLYKRPELTLDKSASQAMAATV